MQKKQDKVIEIKTGSFLIKSGILFVRFIRKLAMIFLLGLKCFLGLAIQIKTSKSVFRKIFNLAIIDLGIISISTTIIYIILLSSNKEPSNNMLVASFFIFILLLGLAKIKIDKLAKKKEAKKIDKLNVNLRDRFLAINFKDSLARFPLRVKINPQDDFFEEHIFYSDIPLNSWKKNKESIEEILNQRIIDIYNHEKDTSMKIVKTSRLEEPKYVKFESKYLSKNPYELYLGLDIYGQPTYINYRDLPQCIIAGGTNTGKSTSAFSFYTQIRLHKINRIILCDFKQVTFKSLVKYNNNKPCIVDKNGFMDMMKWAKKENKRRMDLFKQFDDCENLEEYNNLVPEGDQLKNQHIFIDELAIIMTDKPDKELEELIKHISQTGRSQGFYLWIFTQRPSAKTVPAEARANFMTRISSYQPDKLTSEMAIGDDSASKLPNYKGRNIVKLGGEKKEIQMAHFKKEYLPLFLNKFLKVNLEKE